MNSLALGLYETKRYHKVARVLNNTLHILPNKLHGDESWKQESLAARREALGAKEYGRIVREAEAATTEENIAYALSLPPSPGAFAVLSNV